MIKGTNKKGNGECIVIPSVQKFLDRYRSTPSRKKFRLEPEEPNQVRGAFGNRQYTLSN